MPVLIQRAETGTDGEAADSDDGPLEISFSSEEPIRRFDWGLYEWVEEILDHDSVDLSRAELGLPFLKDYHFGEQVGLVEEVHVAADRKLRGELRFGAHPDAGWLESDMRSGIRTQVSVGARFDAANRVLVEERPEGKPNLYRVKNWTPVEVSGVPIAADMTVGVGRSAEGARPRSQGGGRPAQMAPEARRQEVEDETTVAQEGAAQANDEQLKRAKGEGVQVGVERGAQAERERTQELIARADEHGLGQHLERWLKHGYSTEQVDAEIQDLKRDGLTPVSGSAAVDLSDKEIQEYSVARAILIADPNEKDFTDGLEAEVSRALRSKGYGADKGGVVIPTDILAVKRALNSITAGAGQEGVFERFAGMVEMLRNRSVLLGNGARLETGLREDFTLVRQDSAATLQFRGENTAPSTPNAPTPHSQVGFSLIKMSPKTAQAHTSYTRQQLRRAVFATDSIVEDDLARIHALGFDRAGFHGAGGAEPTGIFQVAGVGTAGGAGAVPDYDMMVDMETGVGVANADDLGTMRYITTPEGRGLLKKTEMFGGTNGRPIWTGNFENGEVNGYGARASNQVAKDLGGGAEHGIVFGVLSEAIFGEWGAFEVLVNPYAYDDQGIIKVTSFQMMDFVLRYPQAFERASFTLS